MSTPETSGFNVTLDHEGFSLRESERAEVRAVLNPIIDAIADAEAQLATFSVVRSAERLHLGAARVKILGVIASIDEASTQGSESTLRMLRRMRAEREPATQP